MLKKPFFFPFVEKTIVSAQKVKVYSNRYPITIRRGIIPWNTQCDKSTDKDDSLLILVIYIACDGEAADD